MHEETFFGNPRTWVAIAFVIFFVIFGRTMWRALAKLLDNHTEAVQGHLDEATRLRREAENLLAAARTRQTEAEAEAKALVEGAQRQATAVAEAARAEAEATAKRRERMATDRIAAAEKAAVAEVRAAAVEIATEAASRLMATGVDAGADAAIIDRSIATLPTALARRAA